MRNGLKPYMLYSFEGGSEEGALLVFAHNVQEAKKIGWPAARGDILDDEYTDMRVSLLKKGDYLFDKVEQWSRDKIAKGEAHVVDNPPCCTICERWGGGLNDQGHCDDCEEEIEFNAKFDREIAEKAADHDSN